MTIKISITDSVLVAGDRVAEAVSKSELADVDIANSTPMDCMNIIRKIKEKYGSRKAARVQ